MAWGAGGGGGGGVLLCCSGQRRRAQLVFVFSLGKLRREPVTGKGAEQIRPPHSPEFRAGRCQICEVLFAYFSEDRSLMRSLSTPSLIRAYMRWLVVHRVAPLNALNSSVIFTLRLTSHMNYVLSDDVLVMCNNVAFAKGQCPKITLLPCKRVA